MSRLTRLIDRACSRWRAWLSLVACCAVGSVAAPALAADRATLPEGVRRVLFLGDSITYGGKYVVDIETYFVTRYPDRRFEFINVGLPSETVSGLSEEGHAGGQFPRPDLHERLARVLEKTKPDLVFASYGMNDGIYLPLDEGRFQKFKDGIVWLRQQVTAAGAKIIHLTPPVFDGVKGRNAEYGPVLDRYSEWLLERRADGWQVIDVHGPMSRYLADRRKTQPGFALATDGVHPDDFGHWLMAKAILVHLGGADVADGPDASAMAAAHSNGAELLELVRSRQDLMKDAWLTATGHQRPGMKRGLPLDQAHARAEATEQRIRELVVGK